MFKVMINFYVGAIIWLIVSPVLYNVAQNLEWAPYALIGAISTLLGLLKGYDIGKQERD